MICKAESAKSTRLDDVSVVAGVHASRVTVNANNMQNSRIINDMSLKKLAYSTLIFCKASNNGYTWLFSEQGLCSKS